MLMQVEPGKSYASFGRSRAVPFQQLLTNESSSDRHARFGSVQHLLEHVRNDLTDQFQCRDIVFGFNGHMSSSSE